ncbi:hypothetical protein Goari_025933 [Gossypium aridum]|uniref:Uncharacterized protein n=1 Tax=Gossypium aridum TaxID=34290 RepID=A0A7J8XAP5_GOSAI|nr:hypothetical protein [Gossypium aridum]
MFLLLSPLWFPCSFLLQR